jgi:ABC-2 type transport system ATP-binding protein
MRLEISNVSKSYRGGKQAVSQVSMHVRPGVLGLLGPNGAGKSSLMRVLATITRPSGGLVTWNGTDIVRRPDALRRVLGYLPQDFGVYPNLTAVEFLRYLAAVKGLGARSARARVDELLELVNLTDARKRPLGKYSGGMRQRVGIAQALLNDPGLLIVDEPTVGLDPEERMRFRNLLGELAGDRIVILSTHIVSDVEAVAEDIAILAGGRLVRRGTPEELLRAADGRVWELVVPAPALAEVRARHLVSRTVRTAEGVRTRVLAGSPPAAGAVPVKPDLEDAYLHAVRSAAFRQPEHRKAGAGGGPEATSMWGVSR